MDWNSRRCGVRFVCLAREFAPTVSVSHIQVQKGVSLLYVRHNPPKDLESSHFFVAIPWICEPLPILQMMRFGCCFLGLRKDLPWVAHCGVQPCANSCAANRTHLDCGAELRFLPERSRCLLSTAPDVAIYDRAIAGEEAPELRHRGCICTQLHAPRRTK